MRVYGITFPKQKMLDEYLTLLEEAKKRDHRKLGKEMELFAFSQNVGAGLPLWLPKGYSPPATASSSSSARFRNNTATSRSSPPT